MGTGALRTAVGVPSAEELHVLNQSVSDSVGRGRM
jgi:hypothetical protein